MTFLSARCNVLNVFTQTSAREGGDPSRARLEPRTRYGRLTVVPSPDAEMLKVPAALLGEYW
jgi:hypothetical protein